MPDTFTVRIENRPLNPRGERGYYVTVMPRPHPGDVLVDTAFGCPTQQDAVNDARKKLTLSFRDSDAIVYEGNTYATVDDAMQAIIDASSTWV